MLCKTRVSMVALGAVLMAAPAMAQLDFLKNISSQPPAPDKVVAYFDIRGPMPETPVGIPPLFASEAPMSLKELVEKFKEARTDPEVVAVVVNVQDAQLGLAQLQEVHGAISRIKASGKDVFINADSLTTATYALATAASRISIVPNGEVWLMGLYGETPYLKGLLDNMHVEADFEHCGDYKSAAEILTRTGPSPEADEMGNWLMDGLYDGLVKMIADSRGLSVTKVKQIIDNGPYNADEAMEVGLIDAIEHRQDFIADIKGRYGDAPLDLAYAKGGDEEIPEDFFGMMNFLMEMMNPQPKKYTEPSVAIVYVEGPIQVGKAEQSPFGGSSGAFSTSVRHALDTAAKDDSVKAVVLRVDSPGGSALASDIIWDATQRVAKKKPLIVSMGNVAGSGGYYVACGAHSIFADPNTITASIGVVGGKLVTTEGWNSLGITWHERQRGEMAGMMSSAERFTDAEREKLMKYMVEVYEIFKGRVTEGRGDKLTKPLEQMAGGRVYTGSQALELGLVDKLGGLEEAVKYAAGEAGIGEYDVRVIPEPPSIFDLFSGQTEEQFVTMTLRPNATLADSPLIQTALPVLSALDPHRVESIMTALTCLELIRQEGVVTMMPGLMVVR